MEEETMYEVGAAMGVGITNELLLRTESHFEKYWRAWETTIVGDESILPHTLLFQFFQTPKNNHNLGSFLMLKMEKQIKHKFFVTFNWMVFEVDHGP